MGRMGDREGVYFQVFYLYSKNAVQLIILK